ncbi:MAG: hypothetical protein WDO70_08735 [Alphaproteobacteria bacterium]
MSDSVGSVVSSQVQNATVPVAAAQKVERERAPAPEAPPPPPPSDSGHVDIKV